MRGVGHMGAGAIWRYPVLYVQFYCEPKFSLKISDLRSKPKQASKPKSQQTKTTKLPADSL